MVALTETPVDVEKILREIGTPKTGGIDVFIGTVRNHSEGKRVQKLEYSAYRPMAEKLMRDIEDEIVHKWTVERVVMVHRIGLVNIGDIAVVTAVAAPHRQEAFEACRYAIDRVKSVVPIWKKEYFEDGPGWVIGQHEVGIKGTGS